ncbi:MAG: hybrid sensor histidine kinase/response regulator, partial [Desulfobacterium sp.]|nr:hybrid sensor histidine kinase/response regulator [Desulfobacterium sp.]
GYSVTEFIDCIEALKVFTANPHDFDLVMTDYGMPNMNGKQLAKKIKEIRFDIPTILFTGYGDLVAKERIGEWGMDGLLIKPFKLKQLSNLVREVIDKRSTNT